MRSRSVAVPCGAAVLALVVVAMHAAARSEGEPVVVPSLETERIAVPFELLEDPTGNRSIEDVTKPTAAFRRMDREVPNLGASSSAWWLRFRIGAPAGEIAPEYRLAISWALVDEATLYLPREGGGFDVRESGRFAPLEQREFAYRHPLFGLRPTPGETQTYHVRLRGNGTMIVPLELFSVAGFEAKRRSENLLLGAFFGVLAVMTTFGALAFAFLREPTFLWYALMVGFFALWQGSSEGLLATNLWPASNAWIDRALHVFGILFGSSAMIFTRSYLSTRERLPSLDRLLMPWAFIAMLLLTAWALVRPTPSMVLGVVAITVFASTWALLVSLISFRQGYRPANYFVLAWGVGCIAAAAQAVRALGWAPSNLFTDFGLQASVLFTFVALSLGIVDRMVGMRSDLERSVEDIRRLEREDAAKRTFLATASHDLRQPLHAVGLLLGALRERLRDDDSVGLLEKVQAATAEMSDLFNALLDISRLDAGLLRTRPTTVPLKPLLERLAEEFSAQAKIKGIAFSAEAVDASVHSDPILLVRILRNLLTNALRYTDEGSIRILARTTAKDVAITVVDTGRGIPAEARDQIFEPFRRLGPETDAGEALGLGLAIVHRLAGLLGHPVELESTEGRGTAFTLRLDRVADDPGAETEDGACEAEASPRSGRILVVDDDAAVRTGMRAQLESWGYAVATAASREEALAAVADAAPAVIFADYQLATGETGIEVIDDVRARLGRAVPAVVVSGDTSADVADVVRAAGLLFLTKPVLPSRLRMALDHARERRT